MVYSKIDLYTNYVNDWFRSLEIASSFVMGLEQGWMTGYSYNRYSGDRPLSYITVRFNFKDDKEGKRKAEEIITELLSRKLIVGKEEWSSFVVSASVQFATEVSAKCALAFKSWMDKNPKTLEYYLASPNNRVEFMARFLVIFLQQLGFQTYFEEYPLSPDLVNSIADCAKYCAEQVRDNFQEKLDIVFMERVIHHFLNCVHASLNEEQYVYQQIQHWEWLGNLLANKRT